jgi:hypothetical protein
MKKGFTMLRFSEEDFLRAEESAIALSKEILENDVLVASLLESKRMAKIHYTNEQKDENISISCSHLFMSSFDAVSYLES